MKPDMTMLSVILILLSTQAFAAKADAFKYDGLIYYYDAPVIIKGCDLGKASSEILLVQRLINKVEEDKKYNGEVLPSGCSVKRVTKLPEAGNDASIDAPL